MEVFFATDTVYNILHHLSTCSNSVYVLNKKDRWTDIYRHIICNMIQFFIYNDGHVKNKKN
jgi:hypothetical protein